MIDLLALKVFWAVFQPFNGEIYFRVIVNLFNYRQCMGLIITPLYHELLPGSHLNTYQWTLHGCSIFYPLGMYMYVHDHLKFLQKPFTVEQQLWTTCFITGVCVNPEPTLTMRMTYLPVLGGLQRLKGSRWSAWGWSRSLAQSWESEWSSEQAIEK